MYNAKFLIQIEGCHPVPFECSILDWKKTIRSAALLLLSYQDNPQARCVVKSVPLGVTALILND